MDGFGLSHQGEIELNDDDKIHDNAECEDSEETCKKETIFMWSLLVKIREYFTHLFLLTE